MDALDGLTVAKLREDTVNERTVGRYCPENRAPPKNYVLKKDENAKSVPSIPSRWETTLYKGKREVLGFGVLGLRFDKDSNKGSGPSPGSYEQPKSFHQELTDRDGWGKRGTGGFASRSRRFGARSLPQMPVAGVGCPGPGAYNELSALNRTKDPKCFNKAEHSGAFANPLNPGMPKEPTPGPGTYSKIFKPDAPDVSAAMAAFKSKTNHLTLQGSVGGAGDAANMPGPGEYYDLTTAVISPRERIGGHLKNAVFSEPCRRKICRVHPDLPTSDYKGREVLRDFAEEVGRECIGIERAAMNRVGPGHYDQDRDKMFEGLHCGTRGSSSFQHGPARHDWAPEEVRLAPGPGNYNPPPAQKAGMALTSALSAFDSKSERGKYSFPSAPGPCYYAVPAPLLKQGKSFRLNQKRMWA